MSKQRFLIPFVALVAVIGVALGALALMKKPPSTAHLRHDISALQSQLARADTQLKSDQAQMASLASTSNVAGLQNTVTGLQGQVGGLSKTMGGVQTALHKYQLCIPEMMNYVNGMQTNGSWVQYGSTQLMTYPVSVSSNVQISGDCTSTLYSSH